jgi:hypothetical protein
MKKLNIVLLIVGLIVAPVWLSANETAGASATGAAAANTAQTAVPEITPEPTAASANASASGPGFFGTIWNGTTYAVSSVFGYIGGCCKATGKWIDHKIGNSVISAFWQKHKLVIVGVSAAATTALICYLVYRWRESKRKQREKAALEQTVYKDAPGYAAVYDDETGKVHIITHN